MRATGIVELDLHGKNQYQARIAIATTLRRAGVGVYRVRIIHGFNSGTALRALVRQEFAAHPKVLRIESGTNAGVTELVLREWSGS